MSTATVLRELLRELDAVLRVVAPVEHPAGASPLVVTFADCEIGPEFVPGLNGFSALHLDTFAAWLRGDESLVGRPVVAVAIDRAIHSTTVGGTFYRDNALESLRDTVLHELAHAVAFPTPAAEDRVEPAAFRSWIADRLSSVPSDVLFSSPAAHDSGWWTRYVVAIARLAAVAPRVYPADSFSTAVERYGYGGKHDAVAWLSAARAGGDLHVGSITDAAARRSEEFSRLLDKHRPQAAEPLSAVATSQEQ